MTKKVESLRLEPYQKQDFIRGGLAQSSYICPLGQMGLRKTICTSELVLSLTLFNQSQNKEFIILYVNT
jgi:hypothetical protein